LADGSALELDRLLGCTFAGERQVGWVMSRSAADAGTRYGGAAGFDPGPSLGTRRFEYRGRRMDLQLTLDGES